MKMHGRGGHPAGVGEAARSLQPRRSGGGASETACNSKIRELQAVLFLPPPSSFCRLSVSARRSSRPRRASPAPRESKPREALPSTKAVAQKRVGVAGPLAGGLETAALPKTLAPGLLPPSLRRLFLPSGNSAGAATSFRGSETAATGQEEGALVLQETLRGPTYTARVSPLSPASVMLLLSLLTKMRQRQQQQQQRDSADSCLLYVQRLTGPPSPTALRFMHAARPFICFNCTRRFSSSAAKLAHLERHLRERLAKQTSSGGGRLTVSSHFGHRGAGRPSGVVSRERTPWSSIGQWIAEAAESPVALSEGEHLGGEGKGFGGDAERHGDTQEKLETVAAAFAALADSEERQFELDVSARGGTGAASGAALNSRGSLSISLLGRRGPSWTPPVALLCLSRMLHQRPLPAADASKLPLGAVSFKEEKGAVSAPAEAPEAELRKEASSGVGCEAGAENAAGVDSSAGEGSSSSQLQVFEASPSSALALSEKAQTLLWRWSWGGTGEAALAAAEETAALLAALEDSLKKARRRGVSPAEAAPSQTLEAKESDPLRVRDSAFEARLQERLRVEVWVAALRKAAAMLAPGVDASQAALEALLASDETPSAETLAKVVALREALWKSTTAARFSCEAAQRLSATPLSGLEDIAGQGCACALCGSAFSVRVSELQQRLFMTDAVAVVRRLSSPQVVAQLGASVAGLLSLALSLARHAEESSFAASTQERPPQPTQTAKAFPEGSSSVSEQSAAGEAAVADGEEKRRGRGFLEAERAALRRAAWELVSDSAMGLVSLDFGEEFGEESLAASAGQGTTECERLRRVCCNTGLQLQSLLSAVCEAEALRSAVREGRVSSGRSVWGGTTPREALSLSSAAELAAAAAYRSFASRTDPEGSLEAEQRQLLSVIRRERKVVEEQVRQGEAAVQGACAESATRFSLALQEDFDHPRSLPGDVLYVHRACFVEQQRRRCAFLQFLGFVQTCALREDERSLEGVGSLLLKLSRCARPLSDAAVADDRAFLAAPKRPLPAATFKPRRRRF